MRAPYLASRYAHLGIGLSTPGWTRRMHTQVMLNSALLEPSKSRPTCCTTPTWAQQCQAASHQSPQHPLHQALWQHCMPAVERSHSTCSQGKGAQSAEPAYMNPGALAPRCTGAARPYISARRPTRSSRQVTQQGLACLHSGWNQLRM